MDSGLNKPISKRHKRETGSSNVGTQEPEETIVTSTGPSESATIIESDEPAVERFGRIPVADPFDIADEPTTITAYPDATDSRTESTATGSDFGKRPVGRPKGSKNAAKIPADLNLEKLIANLHETLAEALKAPELVTELDAKEYAASLRELQKHFDLPVSEKQMAAGRAIVSIGGFYVRVGMKAYKREKAERKNRSIQTPPPATPRAAEPQKQAVNGTPQPSVEKVTTINRQPDKITNPSQLWDEPPIDSFEM